MDPFTADHPGQSTWDIGIPLVAKGDSCLQAASIHDTQRIKIDGEGFEKPVLANLQDALARLRPKLVRQVAYGGSLAFTSLDEFCSALPAGHQLLPFDRLKADGQVDRRRTSRAGRTGVHRLLPGVEWRNSGQDDLVAVLEEWVDLIPMGNP